MKTPHYGLLLLVSCALTLPVRGETDLFEYALKRDATFTAAGGGAGAMAPIPGQDAFDFETGLGSLSFVIDQPGAHYLGLFLDLSIDEQVNTFFNEYGAVWGLAGAGLTWEIDEPGYSFGNIFGNLESAHLENNNAIPATAPDDVSMALGWDFILAENQKAEVQFLVSGVAPSSGFYLQQTDPNSKADLYLSGRLQITETQNAVPERGTSLLLLLTALASLVLFHKIAPGHQRNSNNPN